MQSPRSGLFLLKKKMPDGTFLLNCVLSSLGNVTSIPQLVPKVPSGTPRGKKWGGVVEINVQCLDFFLSDSLSQLLLELVVVGELG